MRGPRSTRTWLNDLAPSGPYGQVARVLFWLMLTFEAPVRVAPQVSVMMPVAQV